ncbi:hypothetical protein AQUCO_02500204v1 [Aquilegia coerulea]|uniref:Peptidase metallopeptidase domain-containing protein n=1 Tax=Aquilegia coerulea TaxID=218851 RepID=A0A2G5DA04_AQUCA|nr:hypothetical protein AQUCO_02500204v1 [Aquilegia coerulea]
MKTKYKSPYHGVNSYIMKDFPSSLKCINRSHSSWDVARLTNSAKLKVRTMSVKFSSLIVSILVLLPILFARTPPSDDLHNKKPNAFDFLKNLQGCHKGENVTGVHELKHYLEKFGYLSDHVDDDDFDEFLESALKKYQTNYHLNTTGTLDAETVEKMKKPRCGIPDVVNGTSTMQPGKKKRHDSTKLHTVGHYSFFPGNPKWTHLTYAFDTSANRDILAPIFVTVFSKWSAVSLFTFEEIADYTVSDIVIGVHSGSHGDGNPFDGPGGTLAHAFAPSDGRLHFDADESWSTSTVPVAGSIDLQTVALHEVGHILGLEHSEFEGALMYPSVEPGVRKDIAQDDINGIQALYN